MAALGQHQLQRFVHALPVQPLNQLGHRSCEDLADAEEGCDGNRPSSLHLLPMARGEAEGQHVLLRVPALFAKLTHSGSQSAEELFLIRHAPRIKVVRAKTPRAD